MNLRLPWLMVVLLGLTALLAVTGLCVGSTGWEWAFGQHTEAAARTVLWEIRAPRTLASFLVGCLLGLSGAVAQGLFRNPLAEPYLLGTSSGAALFIALALATGSLGDASAWWASWGLTGVAFVGALAGVWATLVLARGATQTIRLLLCGVVVSVVSGAVTQLLMVRSAETWRTMQAFMLGNTGLLSWSSCLVLALTLVVALPVGILLSRVLDALSLGEDVARSLGVSLGAARATLVTVLALACGAAVAQAGLVAFVGLVAPHLVRPWSLSRHRSLLLLSSWVGGLLLLAGDVMARWLLAPQELPVGVLTAVLGGAYLLLQLYQQERQ
ncbi:MAG: iron ABC transporter permease [Burkholderiales bacterium]|nr:iron ABC transporter permease [Burkholderiales bacterium]